MTDFKQATPEGGYILKDLFADGVGSNESKRNSNLATAITWPESSASNQSYQPLIEQPALFCHFADLGMDPVPQKILKFANKFGLLGEFEPVRDSLSEQLAYKIQAAEFIDYWYQHLHAFVPMMRLWNAITKEYTQYLKSIIKWQPDYSCVRYRHEMTESAVIASKTIENELFLSFVPGDLLRPAQVVLASIINENLTKYCSPVLSLTDKTHTKWQLDFDCQNLIGVIWLQFAKAVESHLEYRRCLACKNPFIPHSGERGKKKMFCTDACKSKSYRNKLKKKLTR